MPELPEVENFRQLLLPLMGGPLTMELQGDHPRVKIEELIGDISRKKSESVVCTDILRRGKQICLVLSSSKTIKYMFLHMGMTGRIRVYGKSENWGDKKENGSSGHSEVPLDDETLPPKYTCITFSSPKSNYTAYFCDPRKFGSAYIANALTDLESLAPDALTCTDRKTIDDQILPALMNQRLGIKAILLDQKRAVSGVGNWVADEVLYQCKMHPDQTKLDHYESTMLYEKLHEVVSIAVQSLKEDRSYPENWLFHYRWTGKKSGKDAEGRSISFITSGGRTTAIINTLQKLYTRNTPSKKAASKAIAIEMKEKVLLDVSSPTKVTSRADHKSKRSTITTINDIAIVSPTFDDNGNSKKQSTETKVIKSKPKRKEAKTESSSTKRLKVKRNEVIEQKVLSQRKSPRFNTVKS